jgi:hypothetical protein
MVERLPDANAPPAAGSFDLVVDDPGSVARHDVTNLSCGICARPVPARAARTAHGGISSGLHGNQNRSQRPSVLTAAPGVQYSASASGCCVTRRRHRDLRLKAHAARPKLRTRPCVARAAVAPCTLTRGSLARRMQHERAPGGSSATPSSRFAGCPAKSICPMDGV